jgi:antitoxin component YwqK of YwqJK toxin-antitoxin module
VLKSYHDYNKKHINSIEQVTQDYKKHGVQKYFLEDGCLWKEENFKYGVQEGEQKLLYCNGQINVISNYKDGQKNGEHKTFKYDKEKYYLDEKITYEQDVVIEYLTFHSNGNKKEHLVVNGLCSEFFKNGVKKIEYTNANGLKEGKMTTWTENNRLLSIENYKQGQKNGISEYYDVNGKIYRTEYWMFISNNYSSKKCGVWKFYYQEIPEKWIITDIVDSADYFRLIDFDFEVPKLTYKYSKTEKVYKATDFYITGEKQWEGYLEEEYSNTSDFQYKTWIEVGETKYYRKDGKLEFTGFYMNDRDQYKNVPIKVETWLFYGDGNEVIGTEVWQASKNYNSFSSKLVSKKDKTQLKIDDDNFKNYVVEGDKLEIEGKYEEAYKFFVKAQEIYPNNSEIKQKIEQNSNMIKEQKEKIEEAKTLFNKSLSYNSTIEKELSSLYVTKDLVKSELLGEEYTKIKKKNLFEGYLLYKDYLNGKINSSTDIFYKNEVLNELIKLTEKMKILIEEDTKEMEKLLKTEKEIENIKKIFKL